MNYQKALSKRINSVTGNTSKAQTGSAVALALVGGIAIGAIVSLLFAPQSGEETRGMIADKSKDLKDDLQGRFNKAASKIKSQTNELVGRAKDKYDEALDGFEHKV